MIGLVLIFGLFFGCTSHPLIEEAKLELSNGTYGNALKVINKAIEQEPDNPSAHYYRGFIYYNIAQSRKNIAKRTPAYRNMRKSLIRSDTLYHQQRTSARERRDIPDLIQSAWSTEHNAGVQTLENDKQNLPLALAHFTNAVTIQPDSLISHEMMAETYFRMDSLAQATRTLEHIRSEFADTVSPDHIMRLVYLYTRQDSLNKATDLYLSADSLFADSTDLLQQLASYHLQRDNYQQAVDLLTELIDHKPQDADLRLAMGTQLYKLAEQQLQSVHQFYEQALPADTAAISDSLSAALTVPDSLQFLRQKADNNLSQAEVQYLKAGNLDSDNINTFNAIGTFFQNAAGLYAELQPYVPPKQRQQIDLFVKDYLQTAMPYLERVAENNPEETRHWRNLYHVYSYLGMTNKADEAFKKADL